MTVITQVVINVKQSVFIQTECEMTKMSKESIACDVCESSTVKNHDNQTS